MFLLSSRLSGTDAYVSVAPLQIHFTGHFLPWHRSFTHRFERALREECGFKGGQPYWDWTKGLYPLRAFRSHPNVLISNLDAKDFYNSPIFDPDLKSGLGGWGDPKDDFQITTGAFSYDFDRPYPVQHRLRRNFSVTPPTGGFGDGTPPNPALLDTAITPEVVKALVDDYAGDFVGFQARFESGPHGAVHLMVSGYE